MASKKDEGLRGAKLLKKALANAASVIPTPEPVTVAKKLLLPNGEKLNAALKELLSFDGSFIGIEYDDEEFEVEGTSLEDIVEEEFGEEAVPAFGEAIEMLTDDCVAFAAATNPKACLYTGEPDEAGEYAVLLLSYEGGVAKVGFAPFDVWVAQELGHLPKTGFAEVPEAYAPAQKALAEANGDGRVVFEPKAGAAPAEDEEEDEKEEADAEG